MTESSAGIFTVLIEIYLATLAANIIISCIQLYDSPTRVQKAILLNWLAISFSTIANGFFPENTFLTIFVSSVGTFISQSILGFLLGEIRAVRFSWKPIFPVFIATCGLSAALAFGPWKINFELYALPIVIGGTFPFFYAFYQVLKAKTSAFTMVQKLFSGTALIMSLHYFDWPYFRTQPQLLMIGFFVAFGLYHVLSILIPMMANENSMAIRNANLEQEVKRKVEEIRQSESISRMKDNFLSSVSHELRTPLNAIIGYSDLLRSGDLRSDNELQSAYEVIHRSSRMQMQIVEQLLDVSTIISGKVKFRPRKINPSKVGHEIIEEIRPLARNKQLELNYEIPLDLPEISADPLLLHQICWNLLTNAIKFTNAGGTILFAIEKTGNELRFSVSDNGIGMSSEFLPLAFERFQQESAGNSRRFGGLGLGLSICKELVELHQGSIRAESSGLGHGAHFHFTLPLPSLNERSSIL